MFWPENQFIDGLPHLKRGPTRPKDPTSTSSGSWRLARHLGAALGAVGLATFFRAQHFKSSSKALRSPASGTRPSREPKP